MRPTGRRASALLRARAGRTPRATRYDKLPTSRFYNKGAHTGQPLKHEQKTLAEKWAAAEGS